MKRSLRILVVDDDADNANSLGELFELEGHRPLVVYDGESAIAAYLKEDFDIAFMDVMMPGKNGVESFLEIKRLKPLAKVYMMTGYSVEQLLQQAIDGGAMGVFSKPVNLYQVLDSISGLGSSGVVLVAEDDPEFGPTLAQLINRNGYRCELVRNGRDAMSRVVAGGVDVLVLDLRMPLINGIDVYNTLKKQGRSVPTIIITGNASAHSKELALFDDVVLTGILNKPFDPLDLLARLEKLAA
jgi:two-component system, NtrC family, response regulator HydG